MAKKKKRKETINFKIELIGLLLFLIAIIGFIPNTGIVGNFISNFAAFLVGTWYNLLLLSLLIIGIYMMIKREKPDFLTSKLIGFYIFLIGILVFSHMKYIENEHLKGFKLITEAVNNFMTTNVPKSNLGGGVIGSLFSALFVYLFDVNGTKVVTWALLICGVIMFTGISIYEVIGSFTSKLKKGMKKEKISKPEKIHIQKAEEKFEKDNKIVVTSVEELIHVAEEPIVEKEVKKEALL